MSFTVYENGYIKLGHSEYNKVLVNNNIIGYGDNSYFFPVNKGDIVTINNADYIDSNNYFIPYKK